MATKPADSTLLAWGGTQTQPTAPQAATGYADDFVPPAEWHNFKFGNIYLWLTWFNSILAPYLNVPLVISANTTAAYPRKQYWGDASTGAFTFTLPDSTANQGSVVKLKSIGFGSANNITLATVTSGDLVEGAVVGSFPAITAGDSYEWTAGLNKAGAPCWMITGRS